jgi:hypothetical protein
MFWEIHDMYMLVETTGGFMLSDMTFPQAQVVPHFRPAVVRNSTFIQGRVALGQLKVHGELTEEATDEEFAKYWSESQDAKLAVNSFLSAYSKEAETAKEPQPKQEIQAEPLQEEKPKSKGGRPKGSGKKTSTQSETQE